MPAFNEPVSLANMAMRVLFKSFFLYSYNLAWKGDLDKLRPLIAYIKEDLDPCIPPQINSKIYKLLSGYSLPDKRHVLEIVMQLVMDRNIVGLKCPNGFLDLLTFDELSRIKSVQELSLSSHMADVAGLHLGDLKRLSYQGYCTDFDLEEIARNCPGLKHLDISYSSKVTDAGLRALSPCVNLSSVVASFCSISLNGINDLLSANNKIKTLSAWTKFNTEGFDCFSVPDPAVYPSIKSSAMVFRNMSTDVRNEHLRLIAVKFPNLKLIKISNYLEEDLSILKSLRRLSRIELNCKFGYEVWYILRTYLRSRIGARITKLTIRLSEDVRELQDQLNCIFKYCGNIESLHIQCTVRDNQGILLVPSFRKLKYLNFNSFVGSQIVARFDQMLKIEHLRLRGFAMTTAIVESFVFDHTSYPNLKILTLDGIHYDRCDIKRIVNTAKRNNLDLKIEHSGADSYWTSMQEIHIHPDHFALFK